MPITAMTGSPGAGKSYNMIADPMLRAYRSGRRVVTNVEGVKPSKFLAFCLDEGDDPDKLGEIIVFDGTDAQKPGFWPTRAMWEADDFSGCVVKPGDLLGFDEWAVYFPPSVKLFEEVEPFLRYHRHLTHPQTGISCDVVIGTQSMTDLHRSIRHLVQGSYHFQKQTALGTPTFTWKQYAGHLQREAIVIESARYQPRYFLLYESSQATGEVKHTELKVSKRATIWARPKTWAAIAAMLLLPVGGYLSFKSAFLDKADASETAANGPQGASRPSGAPVTPAAPPASPWRIVGTIQAGGATSVVLGDNNGTTRLVDPSPFKFEDGRAVSGLVDGFRVTAEDRVPNASAGIQTMGERMGL